MAVPERNSTCITSASTSSTGYPRTPVNAPSRTPASTPSATSCGSSSIRSRSETLIPDPRRPGRTSMTIRTVTRRSAISRSNTAAAGPEPPATPCHAPERLRRHHDRSHRLPDLDRLEDDRCRRVAERIPRPRVLDPADRPDVPRHGLRDPSFLPRLNPEEPRRLLRRAGGGSPPNVPLGTL